jgi:hypothetical protein
MMMSTMKLVHSGRRRVSCHEDDKKGEDLAKVMAINQ